MDITFQRQNLIMAVGVLALGFGVGFAWALLRPHPYSEYRRVLDDEAAFLER